MSKVLFVLREGMDADYLYHKIGDKLSGFDVEYVLETGKKARAKKVKRMIKEQNLFFAFFNMAALVVYDAVQTRKMRKMMGQVKAISDHVMKIEDINDSNSIAYITERNPDLLLIYGSAILTRKTIGAIEARHTDIYNIHSSVLPYYKNVHSDFWAYYNHEYDKIGISIFKISEGIDTGDIAYQKKADSENIGTYSLAEYKVKNLNLIAGMVPEFIQMYFGGNVVLTEQQNESNSVSKTPKTSDLLKSMKIWF